MSMDEQLLQELYGSETIQADEEIKLAQVELVEAVAAESGVDLNELDDEELSKFAHYVLSDEDEIVDGEEAYVQEKLAEADIMGRQMARSYVDELSGLDKEAFLKSKKRKALEEKMRTHGMSEKEISKAFGSTLGNIARGGLLSASYGTSGGGVAGLGSHLIRGNDEIDATDRKAGIAGAALGTAFGLHRAKKGRMVRGQRSLDAHLAKQHLNNQAQQADQQKTSSYGDETMYDDTQIKIASAMENIAEAWHMQKLAEEEEEPKPSRMQRLKAKAGRGARAVGGYAKRNYGAYATGAGLGAATRAGLDHYMGSGQSARRMARDAAIGSALVGGGRSAYRGAKGYLKRRKARKAEQQEAKTASLIEHGYEALALADLYTPEEFAKEAEFRAAEILAANGVHPETFEDIQPEEIKLASFPGVEDAQDDLEADALEEYNEMLDTAALHIIDQLVD